MKNKISYSADDSALVEACVNRDLSSWACLIAKYSKLISISIDVRLKKYGFSLQESEIADIRQEVLVAIWEGDKLSAVRRRSDISYWLAVVSGNTAVEYMRRKRSLDPVKLVSISDNIDEKDPPYILPLSQGGPVDELANEETRKNIDLAVESLPEKERLIIKLNLFHDKKYREIADILALPAGTVSTYIKRAKEKLKKILKDLQ